MRVELTHFDKDCLLFFAEVEVTEASLSFKIFNVESWVDDKPIDTILYACGSMSWDGCINIDFHPDGNIRHFCGKRGVKQHCEMMESLIDKLGPLMSGFAPEQAEF